MFEEVKLGNVDNMEEDNKECKICMCDFEENEYVRFLFCMHR